MITLNRPYISGRELEHIKDALEHADISGNGKYTKLCHSFFVNKYGYNKVLLTTSCTDALEMCALLTDIQPGDEVIMPSYTFVSTANAFMLRGAKIRFADSYADHPNVDPAEVASLVTDRTRLIIPVHYAGISCDMDAIMGLAQDGNIAVVEDSAQGINGYYKGRSLGSIGDLGAFSFHGTKNITSGEGGLLTINNKNFEKRAEILWEKGTDRAAFFRGEINSYTWIDIGSSYMPSDIIAAFLYAQLEIVDEIQAMRLNAWNLYHEILSSEALKYGFSVPGIPDYSTNNAQIFYLIADSAETRTELMRHLESKGIQAAFHYRSLHNSPYFKDRHDGRPLPNSDRYSNCLMRLPLYNHITPDEVGYVAESIIGYYEKRRKPIAVGS